MWQIGYWVAEAVLSRADSRKRGSVIKHFIAAADVGGKHPSSCFCANLDLLPL